MDCSNEISSESDVEYPETLLKTALTFSSNYEYEKYDPSKEPPSSGDDFLKYVMYETSRCQKVVTAKIDETLIHNKVSYSNITSEPPIVIKTPAQLVPSAEWQEETLNQFAQLRQRIEKYRQRNDLDLKNLTCRTRSEWADFCKWEEPKLTFALTISQPQLIVALESLARNLRDIPDGCHLPRFIAVWLYSVLALFTTPLLPDTCATIREIARTCIQLRNALPAQKHLPEFLLPLNLFICLISRYFKQTDLADLDCEKTE